MSFPYHNQSDVSTSFLSKMLVVAHLFLGDAALSQTHPQRCGCLDVSDVSDGMRGLFFSQFYRALAFLTSQDPSSFFLLRFFFLRCLLVLFFFLPFQNSIFACLLFYQPLSKPYFSSFVSIFFFPFPLSISFLDVCFFISNKLSKHPLFETQVVFIIMLFSYFFVLLVSCSVV